MRRILVILIILTYFAMPGLAFAEERPKLTPLEQAKSFAIEWQFKYGQAIQDAAQLKALILKLQRKITKLKERVNEKPNKNKGDNPTD